MIKNSLLTLMLVAACILGSCKTAVISNFNDLSMLKKGMDTSKVDQLFDNESLRDRQTFQIPNTSYTVKNVWVVVQYIDPARNSAMRTSSPSVIYNPFRLVFDRGKLVFWGFDYELNMNDDPEIKKIGALIRGFGMKEAK